MFSSRIETKFALHWVALAIAIFFWMGVACAAVAQPLQIGRTPESTLGDVAERVMLEAGRRTGIAMQFRKLPLQRSLPMADSGEFDGDLMRARYIDPLFANVVRLRVPVITVDFAAYGGDEGIRSIGRDALRQRSFGVPKGMLSAQKSVEGLRASEGQSFSALFDMLQAKRFDVAILPYVEAEIEIRQKKLTQVFVWPHTWASDPTYFTLNRKHMNLVAPLEQALAQMEKEGLIDRYYAEMLAANGIQRLPN
ncbi:MAG: hypothetical protein JWP29_2389 [Rhodoferax sp.]|nr:hypothetical protein [Rhodoferax sp.]